MQKRLTSILLLLLPTVVSIQATDLDSTINASSVTTPAPPIRQEAAKTATEDDKFEFEIYGFVRNDFTYDTRRTLASVSELFSFIPYDNDFDEAGQDLNAVPSARFVSIISRFGFNVVSPLYEKLRISAKIEADFCGQANYISLMRIRHAHVKFNWPHHHILVGQGWHPMSGDLLPEIISLNTGAPFNPFSRAPQIRYDAYIGNTLTLTTAAIYQFQYTSPGPKGNSTAYQIFGGLPEFYAGITSSGKQWKIGFGAEYMQLRPTNEIDDMKTTASVQSFATQLFAKYTTKHCDISAKSVYGQNLAHLLMMSGYAEYGYDGKDPTTIKYTPLTQSATWLTMGYRTVNPVHNVRLCVLGGYMKNFGTKHDVTGNIFVRGFDNIEQIFRVAPSVKYSFKDLNIGLEYEYTGVMYGTAQPNMIVTDTHRVDNHRAYLICIYNFNNRFISRKRQKKV